MSANDILKIIPVVHSAQLLKYNINKLKKKKKTAKDFLDLGFTNITGSTLIKAERDFINAF